MSPSLSEVDVSNRTIVTPFSWVTALSLLDFGLGRSAGTSMGQVWGGTVAGAQVGSGAGLG